PQVEQEAERWEREGYQATRLRRAAAADKQPADVEALLHGFTRDVERLRELAAELEAHGLALPESAQSALRDPDRVSEVQAVVAAARERARPFSAIPAEPTFEQLDLDSESLPIREARRFVLGAKPPYSPLFVVALGGVEPRALFVAAARELLVARPGARVALCTAAEFAKEYIRALEGGLVDAWRERWRALDALFVLGAEALAETERTQDEFFHLFEELGRRGGRIALAASRPPAELAEIDERLRSRFEGGLVVELVAEAVTDESARRSGAPGDSWFRSREKLIWEWPDIKDRIVEELG
ncbi:MAG: hypothetical protein HY701_13910, partial [Gemmatimonadetes bacterium]|nr:hypothetical protein [Gemmatimonadota bacterium]